MADFSRAVWERERETARVVVDYNHKIRLNGRCQRCHHKRAPFQRHSSSLDFPRTRKPGRLPCRGVVTAAKGGCCFSPSLAYRNRRLKCGLYYKHPSIINEYLKLALTFWVGSEATGLQGDTTWNKPSFFIVFYVLLSPSLPLSRSSALARKEKACVGPKNAGGKGRPSPTYPRVVHLCAPYRTPHPGAAFLL